jgi:hypothetical protein
MSRCASVLCTICSLIIRRRLITAAGIIAAFVTAIACRIGQGCRGPFVASLWNCIRDSHAIIVIPSHTGRTASASFAATCSSFAAVRNLGLFNGLLPKKLFHFFQFGNISQFPLHDIRSQFIELSDG